MCEACVVTATQPADDNVTVNTDEKNTLELNTPDGIESRNPATPNKRIHEKNTGERYECPYMQLIGALLHLQGQTRPDITPSVCRLARYMQNPSKEHWQAAKRIVAHLNATKDRERTGTPEEHNMAEKRHVTGQNQRTQDYGVHRLGLGPGQRRPKINIRTPNVSK